MQPNRSNTQTGDSQDFASRFETWYAEMCFELDNPSTMYTIKTSKQITQYFKGDRVSI